MSKKDNPQFGLPARTIICIFPSGHQNAMNFYVGVWQSVRTMNRKMKKIYLRTKNSRIGLRWRPKRAKTFGWTTIGVRMRKGRNFNRLWIFGDFMWTQKTLKFCCHLLTSRNIFGKGNSTLSTFDVKEFFFWKGIP